MEEHELQSTVALVLAIIGDNLIIYMCIDTYEPRHEISNNVVSATSKASDKPAYTRSLIRAFASHMNSI